MKELVEHSAQVGLPVGISPLAKHASQGSLTCQTTRNISRRASMPMDFPSVRSCTFMPSYPAAGRWLIVPPCTPPDEARSTSAFGAELGR